MCNVRALVTGGILRMSMEEPTPEESLTSECAPHLYFVRHPELTTCVLVFHPFHRARAQHQVFQKLLEIVPHLQDRLMEASEEGCIQIADLVRFFSLSNSARFPLFMFKLQKGISSARSDDTKSLKGVVLEWITPRDMALNPPLSRNVKTNRSFHHNTTGALLCPAGLNWGDAEYVPFALACVTQISLTWTC